MLKSESCGVRRLVNALVKEPPHHMVATIEAVFRDPHIEGVVAINCGLDVAGFGRGVSRGAATTGKPLTALDVPLVDSELAEAGVTLNKAV